MPFISDDASYITEKMGFGQRSKPETNASKRYDRCTQFFKPDPRILMKQSPSASVKSPSMDKYEGVARIS